MILSAAEISLPTGNLVNGVYDALGNYYQLPEWVVSDPQNLIQEPDASAKTDISTAGDDTTAEDDMTDDDDEIEGRKREKGKEVIDVREMVSLRARLSENGQDIKLSISESETVKSVARKIAQHAEVSLLLPILTISYLPCAHSPNILSVKDTKLTCSQARFDKEDPDSVYGKDA